MFSNEVLERIVLFQFYIEINNENMKRAETIWQTLEKKQIQPTKCSSE